MGRVHVARRAHAVRAAQRAHERAAARPLLHAHLHVRSLVRGTAPFARTPQAPARRLAAPKPCSPPPWSPCGSWRGACQDIYGRLDRCDGTNCRDAAVWDDVWFLGPTSSGTTGDPKGVMISHDNVTWTARAALEHIAPMTGVYDEPDGRIISFLPLSHIAAQVGGVSRVRKKGRSLRALKLPPPRARSGPPNARVSDSRCASHLRRFDDDRATSGVSGPDRRRSTS